MTPPPLQVNGESIYSSFPWRVQFDSSDKKTWYTTSKVRCLCSHPVATCTHSLPFFTGRPVHLRHHLQLHHTRWVSSSQASSVAAQCSVAETGDTRLCGTVPAALLAAVTCQCRLGELL